MDLTRQERKDTLNINDSSEQCNEVQLTLSLFFIVYFSSPPSIFSIAIIVPYSTTSHLPNLSSHRKYLHNWLLDSREATTKEVKVYVHSKKNTAQSLSAAYEPVLAQQSSYQATSVSPLSSSETKRMGWVLVKKSRFAN